MRPEESLSPRLRWLRQQRSIAGKSWLALAALFALIVFAAASPAADSELQYIQHVDMVSLSHLDMGFTDMPSTVREFQRRYLDVAIDLCWETRDRAPEERFH